MPLLQRRELLQRQRVDLAEQGQIALGPSRALLLGRPVERARRGRDDLLAAVAGLLVLGHLLSRGRHGQVRAVLGDQRVGFDPELVDRPLGALLDAQPLLGPQHLVAVHRVGQPVHPVGQFADPGPELQQLALRAARPCWQLIALGCGPGQRRGDHDQRALGLLRATAAATAAPRAWACRGCCSSRRAARSARAARSQRVGPAGQRADPFLARCAPPAGRPVSAWPRGGEVGASPSRASVAGSWSVERVVDVGRRRSRS